jgi:muramidase (phage lysozyme)
MSLANLIARGESASAGGYNAVNSGTLNGHIVKGTPRSLVTTKLSSILSDIRLPTGNPLRIFAAGRWQLIPETLKDAIRVMSLDLSAIFNDALQDRILCEYLLQHKRPAIYDYITGLSDDIDNACVQASHEWASIADPATGVSHYSHGNGNRATISADEFKAALQKARVAYHEQGVSFEQAVFSE